MGRTKDADENPRGRGQGEGVSPTTNITLLDGRGHAGAFTRTGTGTWSTPAGWYCTITYASSQYTVAWPHGEKWYFDSGGKLLAVTTRNGTGYTCSYDGSGNMTTIMTTFAQIVTIDYYSTKRVYRISDYYLEGGVQRQVLFSYDGSTSDLVSVRLPGTAQHFYEGPTYNFTYSSNRIYRIMASDGQAICENAYNSSSKCTSRKLGDNLAGTNTFVYATGKTTLTSPLNNQTEFYFTGSSPLLSKIRELTHGIRPGDPAYFETQFTYNNQNERTQVLYPRSNSDNRVFDNGNALPQARGNLLSHTRNPVSGDPASPLVETWTYDPNYQFVKTHVSERGNAPGGTPSQYTTTLYYDYEEAWLGDLNGDGITTDNEGNVVKRVFPTVTQPATVAVQDFFTWYVSTGLVNLYTDPCAMVTRNTYSAVWYLLTTTRDYGNLNLTTTYERNSVGQPKAIIDARGFRTENDFNELDQCVETRGPAPSSYVTKRWFDVRMRYGREDRINKDGNNVQDPLNPWFTTSWHYNNFDEVTETTVEIDASTVATTQKVYDLEGNLVQVIKPELNSVRYVLDERRLVYQSIDGYGAPEAATTTTNYDLNGAPSLVINPRGKQTTFLDDGFGRQKRVTDALTHYTQSTFDEEDHVLSVSRYDGPSGDLMARESRSFDELGQPWETRRYFKPSGAPANPDSVSTTWRNARGQPTQVQDPNLNTSTMFYDTAARLWKTQDPMTNRKEYALDANGNATTSSSWEWNQATSSFEVYFRNGVYDELDRITTVQEVDRLNPGHVLTSTFKYNSQSLQVYRTDPLGDTVSWSHDARGDLVKTIYDLRTGGVITGSITVEAGFDRNGRMAWQEDDNNHRTIYGHNARDEMTRIDYADSSFKTMMRDLCGNPYFVSDQNGSQTTTVYNDVDLPVSRSIVRAPGVGGTTVEGYVWDAARRCTQAWNNDTDVTQAFDSLGNCDLEGQTIPAFGTPKSVAKTFDASSNKLTINDGTATTQYTIDACHRRSGVAVDAFPLAAYQFAGPGLRSPSLGYWNGTQMAATFDGFAREETRAWTSGPDTISSFINQYNDRHERTRETWSHYAGFYTDVTLDSVGRTIASKFKTDPVSGIPAEDCTYDLDGVCNREIVTTNGTPVTYIANQINSYTSIGGVTRVHDANGNLTDDGTQLYTFNYRNELIGVYRKSDNFMLGTYTNDAFGRRVLREYWDAAAGVYNTLRYVYDSWQIAAEYLWDGLTETFFARIHYGNGIDEPLAMLILDVNDVNGNSNTEEYLPYAFHRDTLGTITHLTNGDGQIVERYECTPFGKTTIYTGTGPDGVWNTADDVASPFGRVENTLIFQGRELDRESGLYYCRTRHCAPDEGRFTQRSRLGDWSRLRGFGNGYIAIPGNLGGNASAVRDNAAPPPPRAQPPDPRRRPGVPDRARGALHLPGPKDADEEEEWDGHWTPKFPFPELLPWGGFRGWVEGWWGRHNSNCVIHFKQELVERREHSTLLRTLTIEESNPMSLVTENVEGIPGGEGASVVSIDVYRVTYETWELECYYRWRVTASCDTHNTSYTWFHDRSEYREITFRTAVLLYTENHIIDEGSDTGSASRVEDHFRHNHCRWDPPGIGR